MKNYRIVFFSAGIALGLLSTVEASDAANIARGGGRAGGGVGRGAVGRPGGIYRTPSLSRAGTAAVGYRAGYRTGASSGGYYYPTSPYYSDPYYQTQQTQQYPYALPNYNPP